MLSFTDLRRAASADELGLVLPVRACRKPGDHLGDAPLDAPALAFELQRMRVAVRERQVDAVEERLRDRRFRGSQEVLDVVDDHAHVDAGANAPAQELSSTE